MNVVWGPIIAILTSALVAVLVLMPVATSYGRYLHVSRGRAWLWTLLTVAVGLGLAFYYQNQWERHGRSDFWENGGSDDDFRHVVWFISLALLPVVAVPFLLRLYSAWIVGNVTEAEKAPGLDGVRTWLRGGNLICAVLIALCVWLGFGASFWEALVLGLLALLAYPLMSTVNASPPPAPPPVDTMSPERERVLKMLDEGKITAQESAELLHALGQSYQPGGPGAAGTGGGISLGGVTASSAGSPRQAFGAAAPHRKFVWVGLALLVVGFFLPWVSINPQSAINNMMSQMQGQTGMPFPGMPTPQSVSLTSISVAGGDLAHGLGWWILLFGITAAVLPLLAPRLDEDTSQKLCLLVLAAGALILLYIFTQDWRYTGVGLLLAMAGYAMEMIGVFKTRHLNWAQVMG